jgi:hypothetical protein
MVSSLDLSHPVEHPMLSIEDLIMYRKPQQELLIINSREFFRIGLSSQNLAIDHKVHLQLLEIFQDGNNQIFTKGVQKGLQILHKVQ